MKKWNLLFLFIFGSIIYSYGQDEQQSNFTLNGIVNVDAGKITLVFDSDYITNKIEELSAEVKDKKFSISGYIPESQSVFIVLADGERYVSSNFVIEKGVQAITINVDSNREVPLVSNKVMLEDYPNYRDFRKDIVARYNLFDQKYDSLRSIYNNNFPDSLNIALAKERKVLDNESDNTLLRYVQANPNSEYAFWHLIRLINWGSEPILDSIYDSFSETLKNGHAGKILKNKLDASKQLAVGNKFLFFNCEDVNGEKLSSNIFFKNKYTLVDFWYTRCGPCHRQFPDLRDLYQQYNSDGFEIVGISVDQTKDKKEWENLIVKDKLVWKQFWDKDGVETYKNSIQVFPTNFLIDNTGRIIYKNISMGELRELLKTQLLK